MKVGPINLGLWVWEDLLASSLATDRPISSYFDLAPTHRNIHVAHNENHVTHRKNQVTLNPEADFEPLEKEKCSG